MLKKLYTLKSNSKKKKRIKKKKYNVNYSYGTDQRKM